jgi:hypothetical protein
LNHLLDLKQKQANVLEAKATHELTTQAILQGKQTVDLTMATSSQGKMITFFTIITIVFVSQSQPYRMTKSSYNCYVAAAVLYGCLLCDQHRRIS